MSRLEDQNAFSSERVPHQRQIRTLLVSHERDRCKMIHRAKWYSAIFQTMMPYIRGVGKDFIMLKPIKKKIGELIDIWPINFTFQIANNKGAHQTAWMRRLVCAFCCLQTTQSGFLASRPIWCWSPCFLATRLYMTFLTQTECPFWNPPYYKKGSAKTEQS